MMHVFAGLNAPCGLSAKRWSFGMWFDFIPYYLHNTRSARQTPGRYRGELATDRESSTIFSSHVRAFQQDYASMLYECGITQILLVIIKNKVDSKSP